MAIVVFGTPQAGGAANGANVTLTFNPAPIFGDVTVLLGGFHDRGAATSGPSTAGYTSAAGDDTVDPNFSIWWKQQGTTPDTNVVGLGTGNNADAAAYVAFVLRGVSWNQAIDTPGSMNTSNTPPAITTLTDGAMVVIGTGLVGSADITPGTVSGYSSTTTGNAADTNNMAAAAAVKIVASHGVETPGAWSGWTGTGFASGTVAFRPNLDQTIFTSQTPVNTDFSSAPNIYTLGTLFTSTVPGLIRGIRWFTPNPGISSDSPSIALYSWTTDTTGTLLASKALVPAAYPGGVWLTQMFNTPIAIASNTRYVAAVGPTSHFANTGSVFTSAGITNGYLTAPQDNSGVPAHNGKFIISTPLAYPNATFSASNYFVDPIFSPAPLPAPGPRIVEAVALQRAANW